MRRGVPRDMTIQVIKIESDLFLEGTARLCESLARVVEVKLPSTLAVNRASPATGGWFFRLAGRLVRTPQHFDSRAIHDAAECY